MMSLLQDADRRQWLIRLTFGMMWVLVLAYIVQHVRVQNGFFFGDWIIDYRQGFVRRGLGGSVLSYIGRLVGWDSWQLVPVIVASLWGIFLLRFAQVLSGRDMPFWYVLLLLSPVGIVFTNYLLGDVARKDTVHFAMLAQFVWLLDRRKLNAAWVVALAVLSFAAGLNHEAMVFYAAYFLIGAYWSGQGRHAMVAAGAVMSGSLAAVLTVATLAQPFDGAAFCTSLVQEQGGSASLCRGIILWPVLTLSGSFADTMLAFRQLNYVSVYVPALLLAFAPTALWMKRYRGVEFRQALWPIAIVALMSVPLFLVAVDWGRFVQMHAVSSAMVLALRLPRRKPVDATDPNTVPHVFTLKSQLVRTVLVLVCLGWTITWQMPLCCGESPFRGIVAMVGEKIGLLERPPTVLLP